MVDFVLGVSGRLCVAVAERRDTPRSCGSGEALELRCRGEVERVLAVEVWARRGLRTA